MIKFSIHLPVLTTGHFVGFGAVIVLLIASMWIVFGKAGKPGWAVFIPIYNTIVLLQVAGKPLWWFLLLFVPVVNIVVIFLIYFGVANAFGKGGGFALGLIFLAPIFWAILAFGDASYQGGGDVADRRAA